MSALRTTAHLLEPIAHELHLKDARVTLGKLAAEEHVHQLEASVVHERVAAYFQPQRV